LRAALPITRQKVEGQSPDVEVKILLGQPGGPLEVIRPTEKVQRLKQTAEGVILTVGGVWLEVRGDRSSLSASQIEEFQQRFHREVRSADLDGDGVVSQAEARRNLFLREQVTLFDRNADGRLTLQEIDAWLQSVLELQARAMARTVSMTVSSQGAGLWDILDRNRDGVLGLREMRSAGEMLELLDRNRDGTITSEKVLPVYVMQVGLGQTDLTRLGEGEVVVLSDRGQLEYPSSFGGGGPLWFRRMDRNGDGDISRREFLGPPTAFRKLDLDSDGLLSRDEARRAGTKPIP
jgi:hypothetical protein